MRTLLLSIRPEYADQIFAGTKRVELRRVKPRVQAGDRAIVYQCAPTCALTGEFTVAGVVSDTPTEIWRRFRDVAGVSSQDFVSYFQGSPVAHAIEVRKPSVFAKPVSLSRLRELLGSYSPPQSYHYLDSGRPRDCKILAQL